MRYIHERLAQCPRVHAIRDKARAVARTRNRVAPVLAPLETKRLTDPEQVGFTKGGVQRGSLGRGVRVWECNGTPPPLLPPTRT